MRHAPSSSLMWTRGRTRLTNTSSIAAPALVLQVVSETGCNGPDQSTISEPGKDEAQCPNPDIQEVRADRDLPRGNGRPRPGAPTEELRCIPTRVGSTYINALVGV